MKYIPTYCQMSFLESISPDNTVDFVQPESISDAHTKINLLDFVANGVTIKTDGSKEYIDKLAETNPYIKHLRKNHRITPNIDDFTIIRDPEKEDEYFRNQGKDIRLYFTSNMTPEDFLLRYSKKSGNIFLNNNSETGTLFCEGIESFQKGEEKSWKFAKKYFTPHHSLIIADPYLFKNINSGIAFVKTILPEKLKTTYHLTLIGSIRKRGISMTSVHVNEAVNRLKDKLERTGIQFELEHFIYDGFDFHDRYLISNNGCIFPGSGLDIIDNHDHAKKEGSWILFRPFRRVNMNGQKGVFFFKVMSQKLNVLKGWIDHNNEESQNPLFKIIED